jgi:S-DNA-T family DNA segregation ATPase FtsK/SpoIIIE
MPRKPADKKRKSEPSEPLLPPLPERAKQELTGIGFAVLAAITVLGFLDLAGPVGGGIDAGASALVGSLKWGLPLLFVSVALHNFFPERFSFRASRTIGVFLLAVNLGGIINLVLYREPQELLVIDNLMVGGGYFGLLLAYPLLTMAGFAAGLIIMAGLVLVAGVLTFNFSISDTVSRLQTAASGVSLRRDSNGEAGDEPLEEGADEDGDDSGIVRRSIAPPGTEPPEEGGAEDELVPQLIPTSMRQKFKAVTIPHDLLETRNGKATAGDINAKLLVIKKTLDHFNIPVEMGEVSVGPTVTQFSLKPAEGIKLSRITGLTDNLSLALSAYPIRIEAPIPGKALVGIEVPNQTVAMVTLREILESKEFKERKSNLTICLGKDVAGKPWIADLAKMPHLLVAGATGSGKTVCLNAIILSLIYQNSPNDLRMILVDPKRVELPTYNGIPHLLCPAITQIPKIINSLKWAIGEMDRRYELLAQAGKRDIASYNASAAEKLPFLVIVIDELADLMVTSAQEVESSIIRLAQMARAVGIHLVVATQRPSVDVITGLIKANIPARIAFAVASGTDSKTILDTPGAESLVGRGDMLLLTTDLSRPKRIQCCFVSDNDIRKVVDFLTSSLDEPVHYDDNITEKKGSGNPYDFGYDSDGADDLFDEAKDTVVRAGKASASYLQRRLKIGYARAARLLDLLEERGIIGPGDGAKPRDVLVKYGDETVIPPDPDGAAASDELK